VALPVHGEVDNIEEEVRDKGGASSDGCLGAGDGGLGIRLCYSLVEPHFREEGGSVRGSLRRAGRNTGEREPAGQSL